MAAENPKRAPHVMLIDRFLREPELPSVYACADVLLLPSRAEGWSHPAMEFARLGKPSIMTDYGGQLEFLDAEGAWLVPVDAFGPDAAMSRQSTAQYKGVSFPLFNAGFQDRLARTLREAYEDRALTQRKGAAIHAKVAARFTPENSVGAVRDRLRAIASDLAEGNVPRNPAKDRLRPFLASGPRRPR